MSDLTLDHVLKLAEQLTPEEQQALVERLLAKRAETGKRPPLDLLMFDVGPWPEALTLRREDEYGERER